MGEGEDELFFGYGESDSYHFNGYCSIKSFSLTKSEIKDKQQNLTTKMIVYLEYARGFPEHSIYMCKCM